MYCLVSTNRKQSITGAWFVSLELLIKMTPVGLWCEVK